MEYKSRKLWIFLNTTRNIGRNTKISSRSSDLSTTMENQWILNFGKLLISTGFLFVEKLAKEKPSNNMTWNSDKIPLSNKLKKKISLGKADPTMAKIDTIEAKTTPEAATKKENGTTTTKIIEKVTTDRYSHKY